MRIIFVCGSLEPGKDGVGDYTGRLASQLVKSGHEVRIVAINDKFSKQIVNDSYTIENEQFKVLRLPVALADTEKFEFAKKYVLEFDPEWLSLQYVSFSFHPKGLPVGIGKKLRQLGEGRKWHIMFHELWVGMELGVSKKELIWGRLQRIFIYSLIKTLKPKAVQTHTLLYLMQLEKLGVKTEYFPLFGNIPVTGREVEKNNKDKLFVVLFGGIHPGAPVKDIATEIAACSKLLNQKICIVFAGRNGAELKTWQSALETAGVEYQVLGELPTNEVSNLLKKASYGLSTTPLALAEKSGSIAAMVEHGLQVLCVRNEWRSGVKDSVYPINNVMGYEPGKLAEFFNRAKKDVKPSNTILDSANVFLKLLEIN